VANSHTRYRSAIKGGARVLYKKSGGDKVIVASAAYAKQGASESRSL